MGKDFSITTDKNYHKTLSKIYKMINEGEDNLLSDEMQLLEKMAIVAENYEDETLRLRPSK